MWRGVWARGCSVAEVVSTTFCEHNVGILRIMMAVIWITGTTDVCLCARDLIRYGSTRRFWNIHHGTSSEFRVPEVA